MFINAVLARLGERPASYCICGRFRLQLRIDLLMSTILCELDSAVAREARNAPDDGVRSQVWQLLGGMYPNGNRIERRQEQRYPYPQLITLSPVSIDGLTTTGET